MFSRIFSLPALFQFRQFQRKIASQPLRRAILYVPGDNEKLTKKALELSNVDCVVFDCEDGVAVNRKDAARKSIKEIFKVKVKENKIDYGVRINSVGSGLLKDDLNELFDKNDPKCVPKSLFLPKVNTINDILEFDLILKIALQNLKLDPINLIFFCESCQSLLNLKKICEKAKEISDSGRRFIVAGIVFGSDDFLADLGGIRDINDSTNILYARQKVVLTAKAFNLQAIDMVYINFKDIEGLKKQAIEGAGLGYTGKQTIHPMQVDIVQKAFLPSKEKIEWAQQCLKAYEEHQKIGKGAFVFRNHMIDQPTVEQALNIIKLAERAENQSND